MLKQISSERGKVKNMNMLGMKKLLLNVGWKVKELKCHKL
jgi:hypothetical protein